MHNVSEAVKARVTKKLERAVIVPSAVINQAAQRAGDMTSPNYVAQALSQTLCKKLPEKLQQNGATVKMEEVYRENNFVVLQLRVIRVNPLAMASSWTVTGIGWILDSMSASFRQVFEDDYRKYYEKGSLLKPFADSYSQLLAFISFVHRSTQHVD